MLLKKLELMGFKSFADKIEISFEQGITGIVGPNGSGKSNISDAVRWVLGEQNARQLRGLRMEDIIFNGTQARKPLSFCEVVLTFDNSDGALSLGYSEVAITRRVYRSGESEYFINRNGCRLKDIVELFQGTGVGQQGYAIIDQTHIKEIILSKPEDRRVIFHEATGIVKFRNRRDESQRSLERTRQNMLRLSDIMGEMENQLEPLRVQSEAARRYIEISQRLKELETNLFLVVHEQLARRIEHRKVRMAELSEICAEKEKDRHRAEEQAAALREKAEGAEQAVEETQRALEELQRQVNDRQTQRMLLDEKLKRLNQDNARITQQMEEEQERRARYGQEMADIADRLSGAGASMDAQQQQADEGEAELDALDERIRTADAALETRKERLIEAMNRVSGQKSSHARLTAMAESVEKRLAELAAQAAAIGQELVHTQAARQEIDGETARLQAQRDDLQRAVEQTQQQAQQLTGQQAQLSQKLQALRQQMQAQRTRATMLQAMQKDYEGYGQAVRRLLTDARQDPAVGECVLGVVAEIVTVPREYLTAVETALGPAMQHIVTPAEEQAQRLIAHLRERKYGRATFLPLSAIRGSSLRPDERAVLQMRGSVGVAAELVTCDARYKNITDNLLGRTLIAQDMPCAIEMARRCRHSLRIVTLAGDVINPGGSMTGGSSGSRYTSVMGRQLELEDCQKQYAALAAQLKQTAAHAEELEGQGQAAAAELADRTEQVRAADLALARESQRSGDARQNQARLEQRLAEADAQKDQLRQQLTDIQRDIDSSQQDSDGMARDDASLREDIARGQRDLNVLRTRRDELVAHIGALRVTLAAGSQDRKALEQHGERLAQETARIDNLLAGWQAELTENQAFLAAHSTQGDGAQEAAQEELHEARDRLAQAEQQRRQAYARLSELEREGQDNLKTLMSLTEELRTAEVDLTRAAADQKALANRMWEQYELTLAGARALARADFDPAGSERIMEGLRRQIRQMGTVNVAAVEDYQVLRQRYDEYLRQRTDCEQSAADLGDIITQLNEQMEKQFKERFTRLNGYFSEVFTALFGGGTASLVLTDEDDLLGSGIDIHAQPPGKSRQMLSLFSDGEKSLIATALLFAMLKLRPSPFCILDEVEAALDDANLHLFARYLKGYAQSTQFVVVTHRKPTMEVADRLYGVTMAEKGISKVITIKMSDYVEKA